MGAFRGSETELAATLLTVASRQERHEGGWPHLPQPRQESPARTTRFEGEAVRLGWLARPPTPTIRKWGVIGALEFVAAFIALGLGFALPMSGLTLVGIALLVGGGGTLVLSRAMSQRTRDGAYVNAMPTA